MSTPKAKSVASCKPFWQARLRTPNGEMIYAYHVIIRHHGRKRVWAHDEVHAWEKLIAHIPDAHVIKVVPAPPIEYVEKDYLETVGSIKA